MKTYLRIYANYQQNNQVSLLPIAQLAYNNKISESTKQTPFYANHGRYLNLFTRILLNLKTEVAIATAKEIKKIYEELRELLEKAQRQSILYINQKRKIVPQLKKGDKVYLLTKNLRTIRPSKGLDNIYIGLFLIQAQNGLVTYTLDLLVNIKIHLRFYVKLLKPADSKTLLQKTFYFEKKKKNEFKVEEILAYRTTRNETEYLVKQLEYDNSENIQELENNLSNCLRKLQQYKRNLPSKREDRRLARIRRRGYSI